MKLSNLPIFTLFFSLYTNLTQLFLLKHANMSILTHFSPIRSRPGRPRKGRSNLPHDRQQRHDHFIRYRFRRLPELPHLHRDVLRSGGAAVRLPTSRVRAGLRHRRQRTHRNDAEHLQQPEGRWDVSQGHGFIVGVLCRKR